MIINGREIAEDIYINTSQRVAALSSVPKLTIVTCAPNFETRRYLALKQKMAIRIGVEIVMVELAGDVTTTEVVSHIKKTTSDVDGILVQLPLPAHIELDVVLDGIPPSHDVDALRSSATLVFSPVVGACREILARNEYSLRGKRAVVIGEGRLVGLPAKKWLLEEGCAVDVVNRSTTDISKWTMTADVIVSGAGVPSLIQPDMIKDGVVILDAGTSEDNGELAGDADPACAEKAAIFTPVPGGIGPITVALIFKNLLDLMENDVVISQKSRQDASNTL